MAFKPFSSMPTTKHHTIQSLQGLFNPFNGGESSTSSKEETPSMSIARTKSMAHGSMLRAAAAGDGNEQPQSSNKRKRVEVIDEIEEENGGPDHADSSSSSSDNDDSGSNHSDSDESSSDSSRSGDSRSSTPRPSNQPQSSQPPSQHVPPVSRGCVRCFLCDYCTSQEVRFVTTFIADNIANMEIGFMAEQIRKYILDKRPEYAEPGTPMPTMPTMSMSP